MRGERPLNSFDIARCVSAAGWFYLLLFIDQQSNIQSNEIRPSFTFFQQLMKFTDLMMATPTPETGISFHRSFIGVAFYRSN